MTCTTGTCTTVVCGTGGWTGPKPGDPENIPSIRARGMVGSIEVSWFYPTLNAHAVSYFKLYRGITPAFEEAVERAVVSANTFNDPFTDAELREYYYWIKMVTVNGTEMDPVGPASATPYSLSDDLLEKLTGEIDEGLLATKLRERIDLLDSIKRDIAQETLDRLNANENFAAALAAVQSDTGEALTYVRNEVIERRDADGALLQSINALAVGMAGNTSAIFEEQTARATADDAMASDIKALYSNVADNTAAIVQEQQTRTTATEALATQVNALVTSNANNSAAILAEKSARTAADESITTELNAWVSKTGETAAALQNEITARTTADSALSSQITSAQTVLSGNIASVQTSMQSQINVVDGRVTNIGALYTAKVDVNGLVGGFGVYNDGKFVEAGFDVDRFWVGRTTNKVKPFIINNGVVYIDKARIRDADIDTLKIAGNAVTIPVGVSANGFIPQAGMYLSTAGTITVIAMCNWLSPAAPAASGYLSATCDGVPGPQVGISMPEGFSGSATAIASFNVAAGYHLLSFTQYTTATRNVGATAIVAIGTKR